MRTIALLAGARPNYMKVFPLLEEMKAVCPEIRPVLIHSGQHYDALMSDVFFEDLGAPKPDHFLGVGSGAHGAQTAKVMVALEELFQRERPDLLVVVGDVNSTMAGALVAAKMGIRVAHLEAGLRSGDRSMPEEINRVVTDSISDLLLTSCRDAEVNLKHEGVPEARIRFVGNIMIDSLVKILPKAEANDIAVRMGVEAGRFCLVTLHRPSNVDEPECLSRIVSQLAELAADLPVVFPVHPRTRKMLDSHADLRHLTSGLRLLDPLGYLDFLALEMRAGVVVTDSGGVQEETSFLGIPCLTVRPNTERPITIVEGTNRLVDPGHTTLQREAHRSLREAAQRAVPRIEYWDGHTAPRAISALCSMLDG